MLKTVRFILSAFPFEAGLFVVSDTCLLAKQVHIGILTSTQHMDAAIVSSLEEREESLELVCRCILGLCEDDAAVIGLVVNKVNHVTDFGAGPQE
jgi:hypothetical protein